MEINVQPKSALHNQRHLQYWIDIATCMAMCDSDHLTACMAVLPGTVNSEIFAIILFSWTALKYIFATLNIRDWCMMFTCISKQKSDFAISRGFNFHETSHPRRSAKLKAPRKFLNLQYVCQRVVPIILIVPTQPIVTSLWNIGQPSWWSKINKTNRQKIEIPIFLKTSAPLCRDSCNYLCKNGIQK